MIDRGIGKWILPQPEQEGVYVQIPKIGRTVPFGYKVNEEDPNLLDPIQHELEALDKAKKYLKQYSLREVAAWLTTQTGRQISHVGLSKRIKNEQSHKRKSSTYRKLAKRYEEAIRKAQEYEERIGSYLDTNDSDRDRSINNRKSISS